MQYTTTHARHSTHRQLFYQDFKDTFVCNTQHVESVYKYVCCFIRISKILLYAIHNSALAQVFVWVVVLSGFQRYFCMQYTTNAGVEGGFPTLFYQDFKDTFVCNTQQEHNISEEMMVVLSGFQRYFCMQYTTGVDGVKQRDGLFYQDFKDTFVCNTQLRARNAPLGCCCFIRISKILLYAIHNYVREFMELHQVVLSGFQRYFCMQYTTVVHFYWFILCCFIRISKILLYAIHNKPKRLINVVLVVLSGFQRYFCMQYTTLRWVVAEEHRCFIRISKILLYAIHNYKQRLEINENVVLSGFQRYFCMQYTTPRQCGGGFDGLSYQDFNEQFEGYTQRSMRSSLSRLRCFIRISMNNLKDIHNTCIVKPPLTKVVLSGFQ